MTVKKNIILGLIVIGASAGVVNAMPRNQWYTQHYFLMQDYERKAYKALSANGRLEFEKLYWGSRSPVAKEEFDRRMVFIAQNYKGENSAQPWNTDRARIYLLNGRPAGVESSQNNAWPSSSVENALSGTSLTDRSNEDIQASTLEVWSYPFGKYVVVYGFTFQPPNKWRQTQITVSGGRYVEGLEEQNRIQVWGPTDEESYKARLEGLKSIK